MPIGNCVTVFEVIRISSIVNVVVVIILIRDGTTCYADQDDDIIFEDFARLRLKGETEA